MSGFDFDICRLPDFKLTLELKRILDFSEFLL